VLAHAGTRCDSTFGPLLAHSRPFQHCPRRTCPEPVARSTCPKASAGYRRRALSRLDRR